MGRGGLQRFRFLNGSKLFGIFFVALQLPRVSAMSICRAFNRVDQQFDLVGLIAALGTKAASMSLCYSALHDSDCFYVTGHVGPGVLSVAAALYLATGYDLARLLAFGGLGNDLANPATLDTTGNFSYIGLRSSSDCPVLNVVGEAIVMEHKALWTKSNKKDVEDGSSLSLGRKVGREAGRSLKVIVLRVEEEDLNKQGKVVSLEATKMSALLLGYLPLALTVAVIVSCCLCRQWFIAGLLTFGTLNMMVAVLGLRHCCCSKYASPAVAKHAPEGDILVVPKNEEPLHIVKASEQTIQKLFQRKPVFKVISGPILYGKPILLLVATMLYAYALASVLYMPNVSTNGQIHFAIANAIGFGADMWKASQYSSLSMAKKARRNFKIKREREYTFGNRTAAVSYVAKHFKEPGMLKAKKLLPVDGRAWQEWWSRLTEKNRGQVVENGVDDGLLQTLLKDMEDGYALPQ